MAFYLPNIAFFLMALLLSIWFIAVVQLLSIGNLGEYIGKIYKESKQRPRYILEEEV